MGSAFPGEWAAPWRPALGMGCPGVSEALDLKTQFCSLSLVCTQDGLTHTVGRDEEEDVAALTLGDST